MTLQLLFWILMILWAVFSAFVVFPRTAAEHRTFFIGGNLFVFVLFVILGWQVFGQPIHG